jgi:hypothetical protein
MFYEHFVVEGSLLPLAHSQSRFVEEEIKIEINEISRT